MTSPIYKKYKRWGAGFLLTAALAGILNAFSGPAMAIGSTTAQSTPPSHVPSSNVLPPAQEPDDGRAYSISQFVLSYAHDREALPALTTLMDLPIQLALSRDGYVAVKTSAQSRGIIYPSSTMTLAQFNAQNIPHRFYSSALQSIELQIVAAIHQRHIIGLYVQVSTKDFSGPRDLRPAGDTLLHLVIHTAIVTDVRTISSGPGMSGTQVINNPQAAFIRQHSPIQPASSTNQMQTKDLLQEDALDDYISLLNQQTSRRVSIAISPGNQVDSVTLDYLVNQSKPWVAYAQLSNTGTKQTNPWMEQFGFNDTELTGHDDILNLSYATAGFSKMNDISASYQFPIIGINQLQGRMYGGYEQYTASNIGLGNSNLNGELASGGAEVILTLAQFNKLFFYGVLGAEYEYSYVDDVAFQQTGEADFLYPYLTLRMTRVGNTSQQNGNLTVLGQYTSSSSTQLNNLGRLNTDPTWAILQGNYEVSFYLEPLLFPQSFASGTSTMANEIVFRINGQEAFDQRLVPQQEAVIGGLFTVRGYPQTIVAGDSAIWGTIQYNLHIPRLFPVNPNPTTFLGQPFYTAPPTPYGQPDWDLVLSTFVDAGEVGQSHPQSYEAGATLISTGVGAQVTLWKNVSALVDWGIALTPVSPEATGQGGVSAGSSQFNFLFSISY
ncbi:MAG TPA: ShlB/FhaC/HecB family hemolysin secretion/activation protein [Phycisphaerae bacterium]|nr:ShlB/FhaC/HecB family hemolysin secretion/activation protein [Phycisphaerae bacterium]